MYNIGKKIGYPVLVFGSIAALFAVLLLLGLTGRLGRFNTFDFWPSLLLVFGIVKVALPLPVHTRITGGLFIAAGALLQLAMLKLIPLNLEMIWLLFIAVAMINMISIYVFRYVRGNRVKKDTSGSTDSRQKSLATGASRDADALRED